MTSDISQHGESNSDVDKQGADGGPSLGRRTFVKGIAVGSTVMALNKGMHINDLHTGVGSARAFTNVDTLGTIGALQSGVAAILGLSGGDDVDEILESEGEELWDEIYAYSVDREEDDEDALDSMYSNATLLSQKLRKDVAYVIAERVEMGDEPEEVKDYARDEVVDVLLDYQLNLEQRWERHITSIANRWQQVEEESELGVNDVFRFANGDGEVVDKDHFTSSTTSYIEDFFNLEYEGETYEGNWVDGTERQMNILWDNGASTAEPNIGLIFVDEYSSLDSEDFTKVLVRDRDGGEKSTLLDSVEYEKVFNEFYNTLDEEQSNAEMLVDLLYEPIKDGEVSAHEVASGSAILEASEEWENYHHASGLYKAISMPRGENPCILEIDGVSLEGNLFRTLPSGEGLDVGVEYDPSEEIGEFHMGAEIVDSGDSEIPTIEEEEGEPVAFQLSKPFTITGIDGGEDNLQFIEPTLIEPDSEDGHEDTLDAMIGAFEDRQETRQERQEIIVEVVEDGGGSGGGDDGLSEAVVLGLGALGAAALAAIGLAGDS